jgi:hypothetical protein
VIRILRTSLYVVFISGILFISLFLGLEYIVAPSPSLRPYSGQPPFLNFQTNIGTGFFLDTHGNILTDRHVVRNCARITLSVYGFKKRVVMRTIFSNDPKLDLAILETNLASPDALTISAAPWPSAQAGTKIPVGLIKLSLKALENDYNGKGVLLGFPGSSGMEFPISQPVTLTHSATTSDSEHWYLLVNGVFQSGESGSHIIDSFGNVVGALAMIETESVNGKKKASQWLEHLPDGSYVGNTGLYTPGAAIRDFAKASGVVLDNRPASDPRKAIVRIFCFQNVF